MLKSCVQCSESYNARRNSQRFCSSPCMRDSRRYPISPDGMQKCRICDKEQHYTLFPKDTNKASGHNTKCHECLNKAQRETSTEWRALQAEKYVEGRLKLPKGFWMALFESQDMRCANKNCTAEPGYRPKEWHLDHDHSCCPPKRACPKCVRGILCYRCNAALGLLRDSAEIIEGLRRYMVDR